MIFLMIPKSVFSLKEALAKYQEIAHNLEFARELQKNFIALGQDVSNELTLLL